MASEGDLIQHATVREAVADEVIRVLKTVNAHSWCSTSSHDAPPVGKQTARDDNRTMAMRVMRPASTSHMPSISATLNPPTISLIEPTPAKPVLAGKLAPLTSDSTPTQQRQSQGCRLLYSGSLILEDRVTAFSLEGKHCLRRGE